jgi:hypothetical protein
MENLETAKKLFDNGVLTSAEFIDRSKGLLNQLLNDKIINDGVYLEKLDEAVNYSKTIQPVPVKAAKIVRVTKSKGIPVPVSNSKKAIKDKVVAKPKRFIAPTTSIFKPSVPLIAIKNPVTSHDGKWVNTRQSFNRSIQWYEYLGKPLSNKPLQYFKNVKKNMMSLISNNLTKMKGMKIQFTIEVEYFTTVYDEEKNRNVEHVDPKPIRFTNPMTIIINQDFEKEVDEIIEYLIKRCEDHESRGSGWRLKGITKFFAKFHKYSPLRGASYVKLPPVISNTGCVLNIRNKDNKCFMWSILAHLHPCKTTNTTLVSSYREYENELKIDHFPVTEFDIPKIEIDNRLNINVFTYDDGDRTLRPLYISKEQPKSTIDLILYKNHYSLIKRVNGLLYKFNKHGGSKHLCKKCLHCYSSADRLAEHFPNCSLEEPSRTVLPKKGTLMKFNNYAKMLKIPYVIYADFECVLEGLVHDDYLDDKEIEGVHKYQKHLPGGFKIYVVSVDPNYKSEEIIYRGPNADIKFIEKLHQIKQKLLNLVYDPAYKDIKTMIMSDEQKIEFENATHCHICEEELNNKKMSLDMEEELQYVKKDLSDKKKDLKELEASLKKASKKVNNKQNRQLIENDIVSLKWDIIQLTLKINSNKKSAVRDHCHVTGHYRGAAHFGCNINYQFDRRKDIPVILHNLKGYDSHLIIKQASKKFNTITCIPQTKDNMVTFNLDQFKFIDSFQFMESSLETLVKNLKDKGIDNFKHLQKYYSGNQLELLTRKGVYPYDYMNTFDKFDETELPTQNDFYSKLTKSHISNEDYEHAKSVWQEFNINNMGEYHDLYLKSDVLLLADVFENFRSTCISSYKLDPAHYCTAPSLSWDAMLFKTKVNLELLSDIEMYEFLEKGIRGGISVITHRHAKANNKYMSNYDEDKESSFITYLDANAMYSWAMSQMLPYGNFRWLTKTEITQLVKELKQNKIDDSNSGYIFETDCHYSHSLHDDHNEYALLPENIRITDNMISPQTKYLAEKFEKNTNTNVKKLTPNLMDKKNYIVHYKNLLQAIELGLEVGKVHRVLKFDQKAWLKPYIDFNTEKRQKATNEFEKSFFKLMNNSCYGKTMENVKNRMVGEFVKTEKRMNKLVNKPTFKGNTVFYDEDYCFVEMHKKTVVLNKPLYAGFAILDISKTLMYDFHYNYIKAKYGDKAQLLFTDTDSLCYHIKTDDLYKEFFDDKQLFDFSDFPNEVNKFRVNFHCDENKKVIGKFKMEELNRPITKFLGLRSKMYSIKYDDGKSMKKAKGVQTCVKDNEIEYEDFENVLENDLQLTHQQRAIRAYDHELYTIFQNKTSLSCYYDNRYLLDDSISSYAYGHYKI